MKGKVTKLFLSLFVLGAFALLFTLWQGRSERNSRTGGMGISLVKPAFAQEVEASFLEQEAGIAAYTSLGQKIDLTRAKAAFKTVEKETDTYVVGSISVPGYEKYEKESVHCFVHRDGWVVVYYLKEEPTAKMINWQKLGNTKLEMGLMEACGAAGVGLPYVRYYHFQYPDATKFMILAKVLSRSFRVMIPGSFIVYERTWSTTASSGSAIDIDGTDVSKKSSGSEEYGTYGLVTPTQLKPDVFHTVKPSGGKCAIVLVYRES